MVTEVRLSSCAKITLEDTESSINLNNTYPMSRNRALQETPYSFSVSSSCEGYVGFNLYVATLNTNTLGAENIHYIITKKGEKTALAEGILGSATNAIGDFTAEEQAQFNSGINGTFGTIYRIFNADIPLMGKTDYDLYLYVDGEVSDASTMGKTFTAGIAVKSYDTSPKTFANYIIDEVYTGTDGDNSLYYHNGIGSYTNADQEAGDNSYRFAGGDYKVTGTATGAGYTRLYTASNSESDGVINFYCNGSKSYVGASCTATQEHYYTTAYNETTHYSTLEEALNQAVTDGYLTKDNIKNFVCLGSSDCGVDDLYRIIGVFNGQVKLIKYDYADTTMLGTDGDYSETDTTNFYSGMRNDNANHYWYYWDNNTKTNTWSESRLNTVNLNTNYWNYLGSEWQSKIANTTWKVGGNTWISIGTVSAKTAYTNEIVSPAEATTYNAKIGLMYVSDYMYAVDPSGWTKVGNGSATTDYRSVKGENWMYMGDYDWTISHYSDSSAGSTDHAFFVYNTDSVNGSSVDGDLGVRPVFYLNSDVIYVSGDGTQSNPYRIA